MFDLLVLLVLGLSTAFAALRGGLRELSTLLALAIAGGLTLALAPPLLGVVGLSGSFFATIIIAALLVGVFFVASHIGLHLALKRISLKGRAMLYDRIGGGAFGLIRGLILVGLGYLGYRYYLDEARQPDEVRNAVTRPAVAMVAGWFDGLTPEEAYLDSPGADEDDGDNIDAGEAGYDRTDRNSLSEIVTTVTTTDDGAAPPEEAPGGAEDEDSADIDDIADILEEETPQ